MKQNKKKIKEKRGKAFKKQPRRGGERKGVK